MLHKQISSPKVLCVMYTWEMEPKNAKWQLVRLQPPEGPALWMFKVRL